MNKKTLMFLKLEEMVVGKITGKGNRKLNRRTSKISEKEIRKGRVS